MLVFIFFIFMQNVSSLFYTVTKMLKTSQKSGSIVKFPEGYKNRVRKIGKISNNGRLLKFVSWVFNYFKGQYPEKLFTNKKYMWKEKKI